MIVTEIKTNNPEQAKLFFEQKLSFTTGPVEVNRKISEGAEINIIDVRAEKDYQAGHVPGAVNIPKELWSSQEGLSRDKMNILYCYSQTCHLAAKAAVEFATDGYSVMEMEGGFEAWKKNKLEVKT